MGCTLATNAACGPARIWRPSQQGKARVAGSMGQGPHFEPDAMPKQDASGHPMISRNPIHWMGVLCA